MSVVTASAPGKLMLLGEHAVVYGHPCIVTAVDQRMSASVRRIDEASFSLDAPDVHVEGYTKSICDLLHGDIPKGARFIEQALALFAENYPFSGGIHVSTSSDFSSLFGFGSSSASTVAFLKALSKAVGIQLNERGLFDLAYKTVLAVQGKGSGFDVAAAVWGGTLFYVRGGEKVEQLPNRSLSLVVGYTGIKADTVNIVTRVAVEAAKNQTRIDALYASIAGLTEEAKRVYLQRDLKRFGILMNDNQVLLTTLGVSSPILNQLMTAARDAGALGAKLSGAGVGDCMIAFCTSETKQAVANAITLSGGIVLPVRVHADGVRIE